MDEKEEEEDIEVEEEAIKREEVMILVQETLLRTAREMKRPLDKSQKDSSTTMSKKMAKKKRVKVKVKAVVKEEIVTGNIRMTTRAKNITLNPRRSSSNQLALRKSSDLLNRTDSQAWSTTVRIEKLKTMKLRSDLQYSTLSTDT